MSIERGAHMFRILLVVLSPWAVVILSCGGGSSGPHPASVASPVEEVTPVNDTFDSEEAFYTDWSSIHSTATWEWSDGKACVTGTGALAYNHQTFSTGQDLFAVATVACSSLTKPGEPGDIAITPLYYVDLALGYQIGYFATVYADGTGKYFGELTQYAGIQGDPAASFAIRSGWHELSGFPHVFGVRVNESDIEFYAEGQLEFSVTREPLPVGYVGAVFAIGQGAWDGTSSQHTCFDSVGFEGSQGCGCQCRFAQIEELFKQGEISGREHGLMTAAAARAGCSRGGQNGQGGGGGSEPTVVGPCD